MAKARRGATEYSGILLIDKPSGMTSHDVVDFVRDLSGEGRVGHTGTLDPAATGLLLVCVGPATKYSEQISGQDKTYLGLIAFGKATTTDDAEGEVVAQSEVPAKIADLDFAHSVLLGFTGVIEQVPPQYSAIKQQGVRAYQQARKGNALELEPRQVNIRRVDVQIVTSDQWLVKAEVSKGTYIRSLARDIGLATGCPAHLAELRRTHIGSLSVDQAYDLLTLKRKSTESGFASCLIDPVELGLLLHGR